MKSRGISDAMVAEFGGKFVDGFYECEDADFRRMLRVAAGVEPNSFGLGDAVAAVAQPIARAFDAAFGTHLEGCAGCAERRDALNRLLPRL